MEAAVNKLLGEMSFQNETRVTGQLTKKQAFIVYDEKAETSHIVSAEFLRKHR